MKKCPKCGTKTRYGYWPKNFSPSGRLEDVLECLDLYECGWSRRSDRETGKILEESTRAERADEDGWEKFQKGRILSD